MYLTFNHVLWFCHIIALLTVHVSHYWPSKYGTIDNIKVFKDIDSGFNGFDNTFSKNSVEFFNFLFNCLFTLSF